MYTSGYEVGAVVGLVLAEALLVSWTNLPIESFPRLSRISQIDVSQETTTADDNSCLCLGVRGPTCGRRFEILAAVRLTHVLPLLITPFASNSQNGTYEDESERWRSQTNLRRS